MLWGKGDNQFLLPAIDTDGGLSGRLIGGHLSGDIFKLSIPVPVGSPLNVFAQSQIPNPKSQIPNPQSPIPNPHAADPQSSSAEPLLAPHQRNQLKTMKAIRAALDYPA